MYLNYLQLLYLKKHKTPTEHNINSPRDYLQIEMMCVDGLSLRDQEKGFSNLNIPPEKQKTP
jgi:hypothetical protein